MNLVPFAAILALVTPAAFSQTWDYVSVTENGQSKSEWLTSRGKASVSMKNSRLRVEVTYAEHEDFGPAMVIQGRVGPDGTVRATATYLATDQTVEKLFGIYRKRVQKETRGNKNFLVTSEELVFPYPQNWLFMAFRTQTVQEAEGRE